MRFARSLTKVGPDMLISSGSYVQPRLNDRRQMLVSPGLSERERYIISRIKAQVPALVQAQVQAQVPALAQAHLQEQQQVLNRNYQHLTINQETLHRNQRKGAENHAKLLTDLHRVCGNMQQISDVGSAACDKMKEGLAEIKMLLKQQHQKLDQFSIQQSQTFNDISVKADSMAKANQDRLETLLAGLEAQLKTEIVKEPSDNQTRETCRRCARSVRHKTVKSSSVTTRCRRSKNLASQVPRTRLDGKMTLRQQGHVNYKL